MKKVQLTHEMLKAAETLKSQVCQMTPGVKYSLREIIGDKVWLEMDDETKRDFGRHVASCPEVYELVRCSYTAGKGIYKRCQIQSTIPTDKVDQLIHDAAVSLTSNQPIDLPTLLGQPIWEGMSRSEKSKARVRLAKSPGLFGMEKTASPHKNVHYKRLANRSITSGSHPRAAS